MTDAKSGQSTKRIIQKTYFIPYCRQVKMGVPIIAGIKSRPHYFGRAFAIQENRTILHFMHVITVGWLVGFGFNGPLRQYFSLYQAVSQREGERGKKG